MTTKITKSQLRQMIKEAVLKEQRLAGSQKGSSGLSSNQRMAIGTIADITKNSKVAARDLDVYLANWQRLTQRPFEREDMLDKIKSNLGELLRIFSDHAVELEEALRALDE